MAYYTKNISLSLVERLSQSVVKGKQTTKHSYVRFACPIRALQSYNGTLLEYSLRKQFEPNTEPIFDNPVLPGKVKEAVENYINTPHNNNLSPATASEISDFIKTLKPNKTPELDQITNRMLKNLPLKFILYLTFLMNVIMQNCYFPKCWKTAVVIPIPKPNFDLTLPQNYRPISLLSCMSKVFESVLLKRLNQFLDDNNIITSEQFGFRKIFRPITSSSELQN
ncbi:putative RNA-directed DNA polymerase from transposon BS [Araneus ventricosus]|uniref:Putative RNA-directed DNA polymerase from transposon BS n=1 Tax=Araneus ventricosus TaxID=182803 RepID=A0A4Y2QY79_ARAVE|nr:putative RNA-directed DNA polymerase from transposon BS [Araneus ventricosus]